MDLPLPAWLGALAGMVAGALLCHPLIRMVGQRLRARQGPQTLQARAAFDTRLSILRRLILGCVIAILAVLGYWLGVAYTGTRG
jgi:hypothetical protein